MNTISNIILSIILILFPILLYFIYICYKKINKKEHNKILFYFSMFSSIYLCIKFSDNSYLDKVILFCNIPIIISYLKKETYLGIFLSLYLIIYCYFNLDFNLYILILKYILYLLIYLLYKKNTTNSNNYILTIAILQGFFISFEYFFKTDIDINIILNLFIQVLSFYLISFLILFFFSLLDNITDLYVNLEQLEEQRQITTSLFKITHEIKNPIAVCKGYIDIFDNNNKEKSTKYLQIIKEELEHCLNIIGDFMQLSKIKIELEPMDINMLLEEISKEFKILLSNKIKINYNIVDEEVYIKGDYKRLKQVFLNILKNSVESIEDKGIISISTYIKDNNYYILIQDDGIGMDKDLLSKIKETFFTTKINGTGLGIPLSYEIIRGHHGNIQYESKKNEGTLVTITLPLDI